MKGNLISVFSTKGGVGKTIISINLAVALAQEGKKVILVDLDLQAAQDMSRMMDVNAQYSLYDMSAIVDKIKELGNIKNYITLVSAAGIDFLPAIKRPKQASHITIERVDLVLSMLLDQYDFVVLDGGKAFTDSLIAAFNCSNLILFIVTPDIISVYETRWGLDVLQSLHFPLKMVKLVLNRAESKSSLSLQEIRLALPSEILAHVPSEGRVVGMALNRGVPVVIDNPTSKVSQSIKKLAQTLIKRDDLYVAHQELEQLRSQTKDVPKAGTFWDAVGLTEAQKSIEVITQEDEVIKLKRHIHQRLIEELDLKRLDLEIITNAEKAKVLREKAEKIVTNLLTEEAGAFLSSFEVRQRLVNEICDEALGLGPLEDLLRDNDITDIMINNKDQVYIERFGKIELTTKKFISDDQVRIIIERIIAPLGRRLDESVPMVDARLPDGSRVNAIIPPLALGGPTLTVRKFSREKFTIDDLLDRFGSLNKPMADFLKACVISKTNLIVSGGTGSGKTTFLNILSAFVPENERILTIEDAAELKLTQEHWVRLESRPSNIEGKGAVTIRDLFRNTLRMRPDRIIVGECRGGEVLDMLQAMNTGHDGSMTTIHANSTQDVLSRLDSMILMSGVELPIRAIREMISSAVDLVVHTARLTDGTRRIIQITEVAGMLDETHVDLRDIFLFKQTGIDRENNNKIIGSFQATGKIPTFYDEIVTRGIDLPRDVFNPPK